MRLIVHCGLHKTASTNLQHLMHGRRGALATRGIFYKESAQFAAQHEVAWRLLVNDSAPLKALLMEARHADCETVILSSEDLEGLFFKPALARRLQQAAARAGASVEWHVVLREPGAYFASLYAQLQWHVYADALTMFAEIMNKGGLYMHDPAPALGWTPYWYYSFDHARDLEAFADAVGERPIVHDYGDDRPFPGWRLLERLGVLDLMTELPGEMGQNRRQPTDAVRAGYRARVAEAGGESLAHCVDLGVAASTAAVPECARLIGERYAASHARALDAFGARQGALGQVG